MQLSCIKRSVRQRGAKRTPIRSGGVAAAALAMGWGMTSGPAAADVHDWTGAVNTSFHNSGNWNIGLAPSANDSVIILGGLNNIFLFNDSPNLNSLYIAGNRDFSTNGHMLNVTGGSGTTTVSGVDSSLFVVDSPDSIQFATNELTLQSDGLLDMQGGWISVSDQLTLQSDGWIRGHGNIDIASGNFASLNGVNGGPMYVFGGDLQIRNLGGGGLAMPGEINLLDEGRELRLEGEIVTPMQDVNMSAGTVFSTSDSWTLEGTMEVDTAGGDLARIAGDATFHLDGALDIVANSHLRLEDPMQIASNGDIWVAANSTLELDTWYDADAGSVTTVSVGGLLKLDGPNYAGGWSGDIGVTAGVVEINSFNNMQMHGTLTLGNLIGFRSQINGSAALRASGNVAATGGAVVNGALEITPAGQLSMGGSGVLDINGDLQLWNGSDTIGGGTIAVNDGGVLTVMETAYVGADVVNGGTLRPGTFDNANYIYIDGTYDQTETGRLAIQLGGAANGDHDIVETSGAAALAGELHIELVDGFEPGIGDSFEIIWANGGASGAFDTVTGEPGFSMVYGANTVLVTYDGVPACPGDTDGNGVVNVTDLLAVLAAWGSCGEGVCAADVDGSGVVDVTDLLMVLAHWGACV